MQPSSQAIKPYLFFDGRCDEALEFYTRALAAKVEQVFRFKDAPPPPPDAQPQEGCGPVTPEMAEKVMHACVTIRGTTLFVSDGMCQGNAEFKGVSLALEMPTDAEAEKTFAALSEGGQVQMPMGPAFFASRFGMVADRFGVSWMVTSPAPAPAA